MSLMLLAVSSLLGGVAHASQTDTIGGTDTYNAQGQMLKLVQFTATDAAAMTEVRFGVRNNGSSGTPIIVLYHLNGSTYELVDQVNATNLPSSEFGWATAAGITWQSRASQPVPQPSRRTDTPSSTFTRSPRPSSKGPSSNDRTDAESAREKSCTDR